MIFQTSSYLGEETQLKTALCFHRISKLPEKKVLPQNKPQTSTKKCEKSGISGGRSFQTSAHCPIGQSYKELLASTKTQIGELLQARRPNSTQNPFVIAKNCLRQISINVEVYFANIEDALSGGKEKNTLQQDPWSMLFPKRVLRSDLKGKSGQKEKKEGKKGREYRL